MHGLSNLATELARIPGQIVESNLYRAIELETLYGFQRTPPYPGPIPLFSRGPLARGARYTPIGGPASLYMAEDVATTLAEVSGISATILSLHPALAPPTPPIVLITARVSLESVLDVTIEGVRAALGTSLTELLATWRMRQNRGQVVPTQQLGQAVFESGRFQAIRYPSHKSPGKACLVMFPDRITDPSFIEVHDPIGNLRQRIP